MNFRIKRVRIERVRIVPARPILSKRFWIAAIFFQGWAFSMLPVRFFELKVFLSCMLPWVKYNHASDTVQGCCQEYAGASHGGGGRRLSWVRYFSVSSMSMLQLLRFVLCQDEYSKALTLLRRGTRFWAAPRVDGASETQFLSSCSSAMLSNSSQTGKTSKICDTFACFVWGRRPTLGYIAYTQSDLDSNAPGSKT